MKSVLIMRFFKWVMYDKLEDNVIIDKNDKGASDFVDKLKKINW